MSEVPHDGEQMAFFREVQRDLHGMERAPYYPENAVKVLVVCLSIVFGAVN